MHKNLYSSRIRAQALASRVLKIAWQKSIPQYEQWWQLLPEFIFGVKN
jgi:hypothetical protein